MQIKNYIIVKIIKSTKGNFKSPNMALSESNDFTKMSMTDLTNKYRLTQPWLDYHPADLNQWYDPNGVTLSSRGMELGVTDNTLVVTTYDVNGILLDNQTPYTIKHGVGLVTSLGSYSHGIYEWNIELPIGKQLWPAVWLTGAITWGPETDCLEGYTEDDNSYSGVTSTFHPGSNEQNTYGVGGNNKQHFIDTNSNLNIKCYWTEKFIKIYYNDLLSQVLTNPNDLNYFNQNMIVVLNNALRVDSTESANSILSKPLIIKNFRYYTFI